MVRGVQVRAGSVSSIALPSLFFIFYPPRRLPLLTFPTMRTSKFLILGAITCALASSLEELHPRQSNWTIGQSVHTTSGSVNGHAATNGSQVSEYLGIPFAQPPVGNLRFAAPVAFNGTSTINGTNFVRSQTSPSPLAHMLIFCSQGILLSSAAG